MGIENRGAAKRQPVCHWRQGSGAAGAVTNDKGRCWMRQQPPPPSAHATLRRVPHQRTRRVCAFDVAAPRGAQGAVRRIFSLVAAASQHNLPVRGHSEYDYHCRVVQQKLDESQPAVEPARGFRGVACVVVVVFMGAYGCGVCRCDDCGERFAEGRGAAERPQACMT
jgi:hypothetical protein